MNLAQNGLAVTVDDPSRLTGLLQMICEQLQRLDEYAAIWSAADEGVIRFVDKIATEAALLLMLSRRVESGHVQLAAANDALAILLEPLVRSERLHGLLVNVPQTAATLGAGHIFLREAGCPNAEFEELVQTALDDGFGETVERVSYRQLDQRWTRNLGNPGKHCIDDLMPASILCSRAHPFYMTQADAYAVTHAVMYATDFGRLQFPEFVDPVRVREHVLGGIAWHLFSQDFDLLLEYLLCAECTGLRETAHAVFGWHVVRRLWDEIGFVAGPTFDGAHCRELSGIAREAYIFEHMYHTNFVAGMLLAVRLENQNQYVATPAIPASDRDQIEQLIGVALSIKETSSCVRSPWFSALDDPPLADAALAPLLWEAAQIEAVRRGDWATSGRLMSNLPEGVSNLLITEIGKLRNRIDRFSRRDEMVPRSAIAA